MSETTAAVAETSAAALGSKATVTGGAASFAGFFMGIDWMGWVGIGVAVLGLLINVYFSWQRNQREKEIHELTKRKLNNECKTEVVNETNR
ncbi:MULTISPECIES: holin [unclassified Acinetobacter]|uniref:holin n=1 Tax=unclassified Acinetobacter TaxID=196816 RepID=UPI0015D390BC|nr:MULTISPECIES: holin [unclassified Acinetobacter]